LSYVDNFRFLGYLALVSLPLVLLPSRPRHRAAGAKEVGAE
jgi:hypothetical protein